jgi:hypothetical protein
MFTKRLKTAGNGISQPSHRYARAERAKTVAIARTVRTAGPWAQFEGLCLVILQKDKSHRFLIGRLRKENRADGGQALDNGLTVAVF